MKHKVVAVFLMLAMTAGMLAGCDKKTVDYDIDEESSEADSERTGNSLADFREEDKWTDEWTIIDEDGKEQKILVDAEITVPDAETMSVIEVEYKKMDAQYREDILKAFFTEGDIYYFDDEHKTKSYLEELIIQAEEDIRELEYTPNSTVKEQLELMVQKYYGLLSTAPEEYVVAEEYADAIEYAGYRNGELYGIAFADEEDEFDEFNGFSVFPRYSWEKGIPEELKEYEEVTTYSNADVDMQENNSNECGYTQEEAEQMAEEFLRKIGEDNLKCTDAKPLLWCGGSLNPDGSLKEEEYVYYGYEFEYSPAVDGVAFTEFKHFNVRAEGSEDLISYGYGAGPFAYITVTDMGIRGVTIYDSLIIRNVSEPLELLPLDNIKSILKAEVTEHSERYDFQQNTGFEELSLIYLPIRSESEENVYSYIPVWCLKRNGVGCWLYVNAMDGTVLLDEGIPAAEPDTEE